MTNFILVLPVGGPSSVAKRREKLLPQVTFTESDHDLPNICIGSTGVGFLVGILIIICILDMPTLKKNFLFMYRNIKSRCRRVSRKVAPGNPLTDHERLEEDQMEMSEFVDNDMHETEMMTEQTEG